MGLVINGMYNNPLIIYREYIQNAADSIATSEQINEKRIDIKIDISAMQLQIRDNGPGLNYRQAKRELIPIANSRKQKQFNRGFRGIGRLAGLAFSNSLTFLTRTKADDPVTRIVWDGMKLREGIERGNAIEKILSECVTIDRLSADNQPTEFFEVQLDGISRHAAALILNRDKVREYIGETCPVPFEKNFQYAPRIEKLFSEVQPPLTLQVYLEDEEGPVTRPHQDTMPLSKSHLDSFSEFEDIKIPALDGENYAAIGWIAHPSYRGAISKDLKIRCLRARAGNIQIGDETAFDHLFTETRFNRWCVAEIHIVDPRIVPNGRRDYFEPGPHLRNLENHLGAICRKLEKRCRAASGMRNQQRRLESSVKNLDAISELAKSGYLNIKEMKILIDEKLSDLDKLMGQGLVNGNAGYMEKYNEMKKRFANYKIRSEGRPFRGLPSAEAAVYKKVFATLVKTSPSTESAQKMMEVILASAKEK